MNPHTFQVAGEGGATALLSHPSGPAPACPLNDVLDSFMQDGMEYESRGQTAKAPPPAAPLSGSPTSATIHNLTHDEMNSLFNFEGCSFDLEMPIPDIFSDGDGNELLELDFPGITAIQDPTNPSNNPSNAPAATTEAEAARNVLASLQGPTGGAAQAQDDPGSPGPAASSGVDPSLPRSMSTSPHGMTNPQQHSVHHQHSGGPFFSTIPGGGGGGGPPPALPVSATHTMSSLPMSHHSIPIYVDSRTGQMYQVAPPPPPQWQPTGLYHDPSLPIGHHQLQPSMSHWAGALQPSVGLVNDPGMHSGMTGGHPGMPPTTLVSMPSGSMHFMGSMHSGHGGMMMAPPAVHAVSPPPVQEAPSPRKTPSKRRRPSKAATETMSKRTAKAEQGYTYDPVSGRMYRHGPALEATARDNRELPAVKAIFATFQQHGGFIGSPPPEYALQHAALGHQQQQQQQHPLQQQLSMGAQHGQQLAAMAHMQMQMQSLHQPNALVGPPHLQMQMQLQGGLQGLHPTAASTQVTHMHHPPALQQGLVPSTGTHPRAASPPGQSGSSGEVVAPGQGDAPSTSSSHLLMPEAGIPNGRQLSSQTGHGFITSLVTKELQSSTPPPPQPLSAAGAAHQGDSAGNGSTGSPAALLGVARDKWSLFWEAYVEPPPGGGGDGSNGGPGGRHGGPTSSPVVEGVKQEAIYLGKFPTRDQAGRAHDIAAIKMYGDSASTNFPKEVYASTMPVLGSHSSADIVAALKKDSALAIQRTSKYKGVRRTGNGQYEARADLSTISAGIDHAAMAAAAAAAAGPSGWLDPGTAHMG